MNLDEGERGVNVFGRGVEVAGELAVGCVWRDERGESESCRVGEEFCDLWQDSVALVRQEELL